MNRSPLSFLSDTLWVALPGVILGACRSPDPRPAGEPVVAQAAQADAHSDPARLATAGVEADSAFPPEARVAAEFNRRGVAAGLEVAVFAGGCFWGMEELLRQAPGVVDTIAGYAGGAGEPPTYETVSTGTTGHAESVKVVFDPAKTSYENLVRWFFRIHDPTTPNRQGNDIGTQYRSVIFYQSAEQGRVAMSVKERADRAGKLGRPIATQIMPAARFHAAEDYHQDYLQKNPGGYTCHFVRPESF